MSSGRRRNNASDGREPEMLFPFIFSFDSDGQTYYFVALIIIGKPPVVLERLPVFDHSGNNGCRSG